MLDVFAMWTQKVMIQEGMPVLFTQLVSVAKKSFTAGYKK